MLGRNEGIVLIVQHILSLIFLGCVCVCVCVCVCMYVWCSEHASSNRKMGSSCPTDLCSHTSQPQRQRNVPNGIRLLLSESDHVYARPGNSHSINAMMMTSGDELLTAGQLGCQHQPSSVRSVPNGKHRVLSEMHVRCDDDSSVSMSMNDTVTVTGIERERHDRFVPSHSTRSTLVLQRFKAVVDDGTSRSSSSMRLSNPLHGAYGSSEGVLKEMEYESLAPNVDILAGGQVTSSIHTLARRFMYKPLSAGIGLESSTKNVNVNVNVLPRGYATATIVRGGDSSDDCDGGVELSGLGYVRTRVLDNLSTMSGNSMSSTKWKTLSPLAVKSREGFPSLSTTSPYPLSTYASLLSHTVIARGNSSSSSGGVQLSFQGQRGL